MDSQPEPFFSPEVLRYLKYYSCVRRFGQKVFCEIYNLNFLQGQHKSIREILEDNQVPLQGRRCPFNDQDLKNLTEKLPKDLDITLVNKICWVLWQKGVNDPGDKLRELMKKIKDERNVVCHEVLDMSGTIFESKLSDFLAMLEGTLEEVKSLFPVHSDDINQLTAEIHDAVPKFREKIREKYDLSNPQDRQRFEEEIEEYGSELSDIIQNSSEAEIWSLNEFNTVTLSLFVRKYVKKVVHLIYTFHFLHGQHRSIREILTDNQVPLQGWRCPFNDLETRNITEKLPEDLDITLMNKICQALWQKGVNDPGEELKGLLKKIKDERNFVSHEGTQMSGPELEGKLIGFQATLKETLDKIKSLFPSHGPDTDQLKAEIQDALPKLLEKFHEKYDPSNPQDVQRFKEEIGDFRSEVYEMIQESSAKELLLLNERLCQILSYNWFTDHGITDPGQILVGLQVVHDQELNRGPLCCKSIIVNQKEIYNIKGRKGKDIQVVIISGEAGSGKTTILCSYAEGWCKNTNYVPELSSFPFLLCMQFRNQDHDNFDDFLHSLIPETAALFPFDLVKSVVLDSKCLVLCDGYDEANENSRKLFQEFLKLSSNKMKFVVTTRPGNTEELTNIVNKAKRSRITLTVSGIHEEHMICLTKNLIGLLLKDDVTQQEQMKKELLQKIKEMNTDTRAILQTPLYFNLFILLYIKCPDLREEMSTRTSFYLQLRRYKMKRILDKTGISEESLEEFDALYRKWCLKHYLEKKYEYSEADVRSFKREIRSPEALQNFDAIMSSYFSIKKTKKHLDIVKVYCHRHRSEQAFAAAGSICDDIVTSNRRSQGGNLRDLLRSKFPGEDNDKGGDEDENEVAYLFKEFREVISFIPAILYSTKIDYLYDEIDEIHELYVSNNDISHDALLDPCIETRLDDEVLESFVSQMKRKTHLMNNVKFLEPKSLYVLPSLLPKLRPKEIYLIFEYTDVIVSQLSETLKSAAHNNINTVVDLRMCLSKCAQLPGQEEEEEVLPPVDKLELSIYVDGDEDIESLRPLSLATPPTESLRLIYGIFKAPQGERFIADVIYRTFPTTREEGGGERGSTELEIVLPTVSAPDIKLLLQSLTLPPLPLNRLWIDFSDYPKIDYDGDVEEWKQLCKNKKIKQLCVSGGGNLLWVNADSEEEGEQQQQQQQQAEERKREGGEEEEEKKTDCCCIL